MEELVVVFAGKLKLELTVYCVSLSSNKCYGRSSRISKTLLSKGAILERLSGLR